MIQVAKFFLNDVVEDLVPTTGGVAMQFAHVTMVPGTYLVDGQSFNCTRAGYYMFKVFNEPFFRCRIVGGNPADLYAIMSAISWNHIQGTGSETVGGLQGVSDAGRFGPWKMRCGFIGNYCAWLVPQYGFTQVRQIGVKALTGKNGYDDGHQVFEVFHGGKWVMFDLTNGCYWRNSSGVHLNTAEFVAQIANNGPMPTKVLLDGKQRRWADDSISISGSLLNVGLYGDYCVGTEAQVEAWMRKNFQALE